MAEENFQMALDDPLSLTGFTKSAAILERPGTGWWVRTETSTRVWSERPRAGEPVLRWPFEQKTVEGSITRSWV